MPARDFDAARAERQRDRDPIKFRLGGVEFECIARVPLGEAFDLMDAPEPTPENLAQSARVIARFVERLVVDRQQEEWRDLLRRRDDPIDEVTLIDLGTWLAGEYAGRPTTPSSSSAGGRQTSGDRFATKRREKASATSPT